ncbi:MAG: hypothetical protein KKC84_05790 [Candidatus Omnitrophica bacterium]|nr:hypothetical protein [Candidatus Omnitrophota bacterium]
MKKEEKAAIKHRVITMLDRQEVDFLDKLGKDALFSTGKKLTHNDILKTLVNLARELGLSGEDIDSPETLKKILYELSRNNLDKEFKAMTQEKKEAEDEKSTP